MNAIVAIAKHADRAQALAAVHGCAHDVVMSSPAVNGADLMPFYGFGLSRPELSLRSPECSYQEKQSEGWDGITNEGWSLINRTGKTDRTESPGSQGDLKH